MNTRSLQEGDATELSTMELNQPLPRSAAAARAVNKHKTAAQRAEWWRELAAAKKLVHIEKGGPDAHVRHLYKELPRRATSILTQLRTGHIGLRGFLSRIKVGPSARCKSCGVPETVTHYLLHCTRFTTRRHTLRSRLKGSVSISNLLNNPAST